MWLSSPHISMTRSGSPQSLPTTQSAVKIPRSHTGQAVGFIIYTDDSTTAEVLNGGAEIVVTERDPANPTTIITKQQRGAAITSSHGDNKAATRLSGSYHCTKLWPYVLTSNRFLNRP